VSNPVSNPGPEGADSTHPLIDRPDIAEEPAAYLARVASPFAVFDARTQDSGNVSWGVEFDGARFFVKSAGAPDAAAFLGHADRVALLRNAARLGRAVEHTTLPELHNVIESPHGPLLVYAWRSGELLGGSRERRAEPASAHQRFRSLPAPRILEALDDLYDLHRRLAAAGWIGHDLYDGSLIYDFESAELSVVDLDNYEPAPFTNEMGRMFGSDRFMAPEEFERGARIDETTTVFTLGRVARVFLDADPEAALGFRAGAAALAVIERACSPDRARRFEDVDAFCRAWFEQRASRQ